MADPELKRKAEHLYHLAHQSLSMSPALSRFYMYKFQDAVASNNQVTHPDIRARACEGCGNIFSDSDRSRVKQSNKRSRCETTKNGKVVRLRRRARYKSANCLALCCGECGVTTVVPGTRLGTRKEVYKKFGSVSIESPKTSNKKPIEDDDFIPLGSSKLSDKEADQGIQFKRLKDERKIDPVARAKAVLSDKGMELKGEKPSRTPDIGTSQNKSSSSRRNKGNKKAALRALLQAEDDKKSQPKPRSLQDFLSTLYTLLPPAKTQSKHPELGPSPEVKRRLPSVPPHKL